MKSVDLIGHGDATATPITRPLTHSAPDLLAAHGAQPGQALTPTWACPWCLKAAPGWRLQELTFGHRWEGDTKHYHCREAAVED